MTRGSKRPVDPAPELDLAPIMNMVVILIPLLLLSVVFLQVGVINISTPTISPSVQSDTVEDEPRLNLTVAINAHGFHVATANQSLPPVAGCPAPGPTVCLSQPGVEIDDKFSPGAGEAALEEGLAAYDWVELYNQLVRIKQQHGAETTIKITADANVPYAAVVRLMDVARFRLAADSYRQPSEFWSAQVATSGQRHAALFPDPVLTIAH